MFIDLKANNWTLIVSNWKAQTRYDPNNKAELWGAITTRRIRTSSARR
jgi:hypothetical protein